MRRLFTSFIVGAVAVVAALAVADAVRSPGQSSPAAGPTITRTLPHTPRETLRQLAVTGFVLYSDRDCRLHSLLLPRMVDNVVRDEAGADVFHCRFATAGGRIIEEDEVPSPGGGELARCRGGRITVWEASSGATLRSIRGCAPAWHPDGRLTYARGEQVLEDGRVLYSRSELHRIARRHPNVAGLGPGIPFRVRAIDLAWLDRIRLAMSLEVRIEGVEAQYFVVLLDGDRLLALDASFAGPVRRLIVSPAGSFLADDKGTIVSKDGRTYSLPEGLPRPRSLVFSPDEGWLAMATGTSLFLVGTPRNLGRIIRLPIPARDAVWEPVGRGVAFARAGSG